MTLEVLEQRTGCDCSVTLDSVTRWVTVYHCPKHGWVPNRSDTTRYRKFLNDVVPSTLKPMPWWKCYGYARHKDGHKDCEAV